MICPPHCNTGVKLDFEEGSEAFPDKESARGGVGHEAVWDQCPECERLIVLLRRGSYRVQHSEYGSHASLDSIEEEQVLFPKSIIREVAAEVPESYKQDYLEACAVLPMSPKASAALSRRLLQDVIRNKFGIQHSNLAQEIDEFIGSEGVPTYLANAVDAIRNVGNFAAHPLKEKDTGAIVDVEPGEAEWLLEVLEAMFDFAFVQPKRLEERQESLNAKLKAMGKPPMKIRPKGTNK
jgi:hypothetical protein